MNDTRNWRLGAHYKIHGYAETPGSFDDEPIFTALNSVIAQQIIDDHLGVLALRKKLDGLSRQNDALLKENTYLKARVIDAKEQVAKLQGHAFKTVGTARRAYNVLGELLSERSDSPQDMEAACE
jgi:regulator of replication initiation timing